MPMMTADAADSAPQNDEEDERQGEDSDRRSTDSNATPTQEVGATVIVIPVSYDDKLLLQAVCPTCCSHHLRFGAMVFVTVVCS